MPRHEEELAIYADAYIDALLARSPVGAVASSRTTDPRVRRTADLLSELPRFHPSFAFEEALAARLRAMAAAPRGRLAEVIPFPGAVVAAAAGGRHGLDRRWLVGGALFGGAVASGVSVAAVLAWQSVRRGRRSEVVA